MLRRKEYFCTANPDYLANKPRFLPAQTAKRHAVCCLMYMYFVGKNEDEKAVGCANVV